MVMDIIIGIIFGVTVFLAMRKGFAITVIHFVQSIASLVLGFMFCDDLKLWLQTKTNMPEHVAGNILSFGLIVIGVSLVCTVLAHIFSKQYNEGFLSFVDWVLGAGMGCCIGIFYVLVFLALITPITEFFMPDLSETLAASFSESYIAGKIYNHNVLLLFFRGLF